jgi:hypothetical protein
MKLNHTSEPAMTPLDVPGQLQVVSLFPWLSHLAPAAETPRDEAAPAPQAPRPADADLPRAA